MSQISRVKNWVAEILKYADLNAEFNNIINAWNNMDSGSAPITTLNVSGTSTLTGNVTASGTLGVTGNATVGGTLGITGVTTAAAINGTTITATTKLLGKGTATNDAAAAGYIGEVVSAGISTSNQVNAVNNQFKDITTIDLTAGDWTIAGAVHFNLDAGSLSTNQMQGVISAYADNTNTDHSNGVNLTYAISSGGGVIYSTIIPIVRASLSGAATYHLKGLIAFSGGPPHLAGWIQARRVR